MALGPRHDRSGDFWGGMRDAGHGEMREDAIFVSLARIILQGRRKNGLVQRPKETTLLLLKRNGCWAEHVTFCPALPGTTGC